MCCGCTGEGVELRHTSSDVVVPAIFGRDALPGWNKPTYVKYGLESIYSNHGIQRVGDHSVRDLVQQAVASHW